MRVQRWRVSWIIIKSGYPVQIRLLTDIQRDGSLFLLSLFSIIIIIIIIIMTIIIIITMMIIIFSKFFFELLW